MIPPRVIRYYQKFIGWLDKKYVYPVKNYSFHQISFSQEGEDMILSRIFERSITGFYVDIGAHHPQRFSNTYKFYLKGWRGINIDAMPGSMNLFNLIRPNDINLEIAISNERKILDYYIYNETALNTFSDTVLQSRLTDPVFQKNYQLINRIEIQCLTLSDVLDTYLPDEQEIDFISIDVEGLDYCVLLSNNWRKYKPRVILIEELKLSIEYIPRQSIIYSFLTNLGYELIAKTFNTSFYKLI